jgi:alkanesulfonate monooxygenase
VFAYRLLAAAISVSVQRFCENVAGKAPKSRPEIRGAGLDLNSSSSYVTDIRCVAAAVPDRTPNAGQAAALPDP